MEGDLDGNNQVDAVDVVLLAAAIVLRGPEFPPEFDLDGDGDLDIDDLVKLLEALFAEPMTTEPGP